MGTSGAHNPTLTAASAGPGEPPKHLSPPIGTRSRRAEDLPQLERCADVGQVMGMFADEGGTVACPLTGTGCR